MSVKTVKYTFQGQTYDLVLNSQNGRYEASVTAPSKSSYSQNEHKYGGKVVATDNDGNAAAASSITFTVDTIPPTLTVNNPTEGLVTNKASLTVSGKTDDATSKPVSVTVNGKAATVNTDGTFSIEITLANGNNTITVIATDKAGKTTEVVRHVTLDTVAPVIKSISITPNPVDCGKTFIISVDVSD